MKIKTVVAIALIIFVIVVGNIIAIGLLQPSKTAIVKNLQDSNTNIDVNKGKSTSTIQASQQTTTTSTASPASSVTPAASGTTPAPVVINPPMRVRTRAS